MEKILGLDLGTNSIGWAIREVTSHENQIIGKGVLTFDKGVGEGKNGEFPLVKMRTEARGRRRNYQARRYRKWFMLETLITNIPQMCPLSLSDLDGWRKYDKNEGRIYPQTESFINWLRLDFDADGKPDYENPYQLRQIASQQKIENPMILGRVFYNLVQRRGFRGRDEGETKTIKEGSDEKGTKGAVDIHNKINDKSKTLGSKLYEINKAEGERIRNRYNLRKDFEAELNKICDIQGIDRNSILFKKLYKAIIWQRPLRTQKGNVGRCTLEPSKPRCPISHPVYEEFRAWSFINNIKVKDKNDEDTEFRQLDSNERNQIYNKLFFRKSKKHFDFIDIIKELDRKQSMYIFNYAKNNDNKKKTNVLVTGCPVTTDLINTFECKSITDIRISHPPDSKRTSKKEYYDYQDIWHVLFTFDSQEKLYEFATKKLKLSEEKADIFSKVKLQQGYANLSLNVIKKILPYLRKGYIYSDAVYLANLDKVFGFNLETDRKQKIVEEINKEFEKIRLEKTIRGISNKLISKHLNLENEAKHGGYSGYTIQQQDYDEVNEAIEQYLGIKTWKNKSEEEKKSISEKVQEKYFSYLQTPPITDINLIFGDEINTEERLKEFLKKRYQLSDKQVIDLYHPSKQEKYPEAPTNNGEKFLGDPMPISRGFKNPMALKTLYKLKKLINYLIKNEKIDSNTRIVIEIARELTDANRRKALYFWNHRQREKNEEASKKIKEMAEENNINIDAEDINNIQKYRLWEEQKYRCLYTGKQIMFSDLFDSNLVQVEHTIPASISFNNELSNLTLCYKKYNTDVKGKKIPSQMPNYESGNIEIIINGEKWECTPILPRLKEWKDEVNRLKENLKNNLKRTKNSSLTKDDKDKIIVARRLIEFELDYWQKKIETFLIKEYKQTWRNSQLKDTQIVTKYALPYLKTVFEKVEVQKGQVVAEFRKIFNLGFEKDRTKHTHHAVDASVLTLIPPPYRREKLLEEHFIAQEKGLHFHSAPLKWKNFKPEYINEIEETTLVNYLHDDRTLTPSKKYVRKRGKIQYVKDKNGNFKLNKESKKIPLIAKGDSIRGQLHKETLYGAIKNPYDYRNGINYVVNVPIKEFEKEKDLEDIVDPVVRDVISSNVKERMSMGKSFKEAIIQDIWMVNKNREPQKIDKNGHDILPIRHVRCRVRAGKGYLNKALQIKEHIFASSYDYKQWYYAQNEINYLYLLYENQREDLPQRAYRIINLFDLTNYDIKVYSDFYEHPFFSVYEKTKGKRKTLLELKAILKVGLKVILWKESPEELNDLSKQELFKRVYRIYKFNEIGSTGFIYLQSHLEARSDSELKEVDNVFDTNIYQPRLRFSPSNLNCLIEGQDFKVTYDGRILFT